MRHRERLAGAALVGVTAGIVAVLVHQMLGLFGAGEVASSYHHVAVVPVFAAALVGLVLGLGAIVRRAMSAADRKRTIARLAGHFTSAPWLAVSMAIAVVAIAIFGLGESVEQFLALGHVSLALLIVNPLAFGLLTTVCSVVAGAFVRALFLLALGAVSAIVEWLFHRRAVAEFARRGVATAAFVLPFSRIASRTASRRGPPEALHVA